MKMRSNEPADASLYVVLKSKLVVRKSSEKRILTEKQSLSVPRARKIVR